MTTRFQFSLRALLALVVIVAVPSSRLASKLQEKRKEREFVRAIQGRGIVLYDWEISRMGAKYKGRRPDPPGWEWVRRLLGDDFYGRVTFVGIGDACDSDLAMLAELPSVEKVELGRCNRLFAPPDPINTRLTDRGIVHLKNLKSLQFLWLKNAAVTDGGVADLQRSLPGCKIVR